jgi:hypothetical protein
VDTFTIKAGDRQPVLDLYLQYADGTPRNLVGSAATNIKLVVASVVGGRRLIDLQQMDKITPYTDGHCQYVWQQDQLVAGEYLMEIIVNYGIDGQESFPKGSYYKLVIVPHL